MRKLALLLALGSLSGPVLANPMSDALRAAHGTLCFVRSYNSAWLKAHRGQTVMEMRFALTQTGKSEYPTLRMSLRGSGKPIYSYGACEWWDKDLNRGVQDNIIFPSYHSGRGIGCHMMTDTTGASAEEGGDFPVGWNGGRSIEVHLEGGATGWRSYEAKGHASFHDVKAADLVLRLDRAPVTACRELITKFAPD